MSDVFIDPRREGRKVKVLEEVGGWFVCLIIWPGSVQDGQTTFISPECFKTNYKSEY
jgi:hypothetical protein